MAKQNRATVREARNAKKEETGRVLRPKFQEEGYVATPVQAKTEAQKEFLAALKTHDVVVFVAPAGCGKSYLTMSEVSDWLKKGIYNKVVLTRAVIPMGRSLGMLPSTLQQKFEPYLMPLLEVLWKRYGKGYYENGLANGSIELLAPEYARGRSISDVMIIDEAQSLHQDELYTMITRMEEGSKLICIGDPFQSDIKGLNGIDWLCGFVEKNPKLAEHIKIVRATSDDIVRGGMCMQMVKARERENG